MTVEISNAFSRIILLLIASGMILGLINSVACYELYDTVRGFSEYQNEMSAPVLPAMSDLIADTSADVDLTRILTERFRSGRQLLAGPGTSFKHIFYIHLQDGNK